MVQGSKFVYVLPCTRCYFAALLRIVLTHPVVDKMGNPVQ